MNLRTLRGPSAAFPLLLVLALACGDKDNGGGGSADGSDGTEGPVDADLDGFPWDEDCNDNSADVRPDAQEICNGIDDDCDGDTDEEGATGGEAYLLDNDGDGYGGEATVTACSQPEGTSLTGGDCNDDDPAFHPDAAETNCSDPNDYNCDGTTIYVDNDGDLDPGCEDCDDDDPLVSHLASETCNNIDDDCDSLVDDEDDSLDPTSGTTYYQDVDLDTFGDPESTVLACEVPTGYVEVNGDCDDGDATIHPGAPEYCGGVDHDCDGASDETDSVDANTYYADTDGDSYGEASSTTPACDLPTGYADNADDCDDGDSTVNPGAAEVCNDMIDQNCDGGPSTCVWSSSETDLTSDAKVYGAAASDAIGSVIVSGYDVTNDGVDDLIIGVPAQDGGGAAAGAVSVMSGPLATSTKASAGLVTLVGGVAGDALGSAVSAGDIDGDGIADLLLGAPGYDSSGTKADTGRAYLIFGPITSSSSLAGYDAAWGSITASDAVGADVATGGDFDGDGKDDVAIGLTGWDSTVTTNNGEVVIYRGSGALTSGAISAATYRITGVNANDGIGSSVAWLDDIDGDGLDDLAIGAPLLSSSAGGVYVFTGGMTSGTVSASTADEKWTGAASSAFGTAIATAGDLNSDGYGDYLIGAPTPTAGGAGAAYLIHGSATRVGGASTTITARITGSSSMRLGGALSGGADVNGDGELDFVVGGSGATNGAITYAGVAVLFLGDLTTAVTTASASSKIYGSAANYAMGAGVSIGGDYDSDGYEDLLVGATGVTNSAASDGSVYLFHGVGM